MKLKSIAAAGVLFTTLPSMALAVEAEDFGHALSGLFLQAEFAVSFDSVTMQGSDIIIDGVNAAPINARPKQFDLKMVFKNVGETADGAYTADRATIDRFIFEEDDVTVRLDGLVWENVRFYETPPADFMGELYHQSRLFTGPLRVFIEGDEVFSIASLESGNQADEASGTVSYSYSVKGVSLDLAKLSEGEDVPPSVADLGLTELNLELGGQSTLNIGEETMEVTNAYADMEGIGRLALSADVLGYSEQFLSEFYALQREASAAEEVSEEDQLELLMHLGNALFLNGANLRFDDDGITNKLLDLAADEQGIPRAAMTIGFAAALPIMASELGVPEALQTALLRAATDYMISPRSFEVDVQPNKPLRFSRLAELIEDEDAETLLKLFTFNVTANQD